jgi:hypothetical protein
MGGLVFSRIKLFCGDVLRRTLNDVGGEAVNIDKIHGQSKSKISSECF